MKRKGRLTIWLLVALCLFGCRARQAAVSCEIDPLCLRYGIFADIPVLDPHNADTPEAGMILRQIYDTLVYRDSLSHAFVPGLAARWDISADGLSYTFQLRRDVTFHDGSRFDAVAVARNIERIYDPARPASAAQALLGPLHRYVILDEFVIRLVLSTPYAPLLDGLSQPYLGMASPSVFNSYSGMRYQFHQSGTGPFALEEYLPGERIVLRRSTDYRVNPPIYAPLRGDEFERIEFLILPAEDLEPLSLLDEAVDVIDDISPIEAQNLTGNSRVRILPTAIPGSSVYFLFNTNRPHLNDPNVRRALLLATNRIAISDRIFINVSPEAWAPLSTSTGYAHTGYVNLFGFDQDGAQDLLAASGYQDNNSDGILDRAGEPLELRVVVPPWHEFPAVASYLREQWRAIGIELVIEPVPGRSRLSSVIQSGDYDLLPVEVFGLDPAGINDVFLEDSRFRASHAPHQQLNDMLKRAAQEQDMQARRSQYYDIQALLMNETLILPVREVVRLTATRAYIRDLKFDAYGFYPLLFNAAKTG